MSYGSRFINSGAVVEATMPANISWTGGDIFAHGFSKILNNGRFIIETVARMLYSGHRIKQTDHLMIINLPGSFTAKVEPESVGRRLSVSPASSLNEAMFVNRGKLQLVNTHLNILSFKLEGGLVLIPPGSSGSLTTNTTLTVLSGDFAGSLTIRSFGFAQFGPGNSSFSNCTLLNHGSALWTGSHADILMSGSSKFLNSGSFRALAVAHFRCHVCSSGNGTVAGFVNLLGATFSKEAVGVTTFLAPFINQGSVFLSTGLFATVGGGNLGTDAMVHGFFYLSSGAGVALNNSLVKIEGPFGECLSFPYF
jgi:hypothetical protein